MKNKFEFIVVSLLVSLVAGSALAGLFAVNFAGKSGFLGVSTSSYAVALNQQATRQFNDDLVNSLNNLRGAAQGSNLSSSTFTIGTLANDGYSSSSVSVSGALVGDFVLVSSNATATPELGVRFSGHVSAADTVIFAASQDQKFATSTYWVGGNIGINIRTFASSSIPALLVSTTTQSAGN